MARDVLEIGLLRTGASAEIIPVPAPGPDIRAAQRYQSHPETQRIQSSTVTQTDNCGQFYLVNFHFASIPEFPLHASMYIRFLLFFLGSQFLV